MGKITSDSYSAPSQYPLGKKDVLEIASQIVSSILKCSQEKAISLIEKSVNIAFDEVLEDSLFITNRARRRFSRETFLSANPEIGSADIDSFCHRFKSEIALKLYPERIEELKILLEKEGVTVWNPNFLHIKHRGLMGWIGRNIRKMDGKTDWTRIEEELKKIFPDSRMTYTDKREAFTRDSGIKLLQEIAQDLVQEKGYWNPLGISHQDGELYSYITGLMDFRRVHDRPDLVMRREKTGEHFSKEMLNSRPNWFKIAEAMGGNFIETMQIGNIKGERNEPSLRDIQIACDELDFTVSQLLKISDSWRPKDIQFYNQALYRYFQSHHKLEGMVIDWDTILSRCNEVTKSSFTK